MPELVEPLFFDDDELSAWKRQDYSFLQTSSASSYLRTLLPEKASRGLRVGTQRFFGEAVVAARIRHLQGWYGSFDWFSCYPTVSRTREDWFHDEFRGALCVAFPRLRELHGKFRAITEVLAVGPPQPPDMWLVVELPNACLEHRFIEAKMPDDERNNQQVAGLAVIATCLPREAVPVSVSIAPLYSATRPPLSLDGVEEQFRDMCSRLVAAGLAVPDASGQSPSPQ